SLAFLISLVSLFLVHHLPQKFRLASFQELNDQLFERMSTTRQTTEPTLPQTKSKTVFSAFSALVVVHPRMFAFYSTHFPKAVSVVPENVFLYLFQNPPSFYLFGSICCFNNFLA